MENPSNLSYRLEAYKKFIWFVFKRLGKGNRRVFPWCVIWMIREKFPQEDGIYIIFKLRLYIDLIYGFTFSHAFFLAAFNDLP